ncbi:hypothetical protein GJAV_G00164810 [Gymnothorax javanicus]|nr:hypothetical protein GJAV_G00164810 [Gymnothorax javanicus]
MTFSGTWKSDRGENLEQFLDKLGANPLIRKLAGMDNMEFTIEQAGDKFKVKQSSSILTKENEFTLGVPFDFTLPNGSGIAGTWVMEGDLMIGNFTKKEDGKVLIITRKIVEGELVQSLNCDGMEAKTFFKKI